MQRGDDTNELEIVLEPLAYIKGRLVDENGKGVTNVQPEISILNRWYRDRSKLWNTTMKGNGKFTIERVPSGLKMMIGAVSGNHWNVLPIGELRNGRLSSRHIEIEPLQPGEVRDIGKVFVKREMLEEFEDDNIEWNGSLSGLLTNEDGEAVVGFRLSINYGEKQFHDITDLNGRYEFVGLPKNRKIKLSVLDWDDTNNYSNSFECICDGNDFDIQLSPQNRN